MTLCIWTLQVGDFPIAMFGTEAVKPLARTGQASVLVVVGRRF